MVAISVGGIAPRFMITFHGGMRALTYEWGSRTAEPKLAAWQTRTYWLRISGVCNVLPLKVYSWISWCMFYMFFARMIMTHGILWPLMAYIDLSWQSRTPTEWRAWPLLPLDGRNHMKNRRSTESPDNAAFREALRSLLPNKQLNHVCWE